MDRMKIMLVHIRTRRNIVKMANIKSSIQTLPPSCFAMVMATGICSIAAQLLQYSSIANVLFIIANVIFFILLLLFVIRLFLFFPAVVKDVSSHEKGAGSFTLVAASCILGTCYAQEKQLYDAASIFWTFAIVTWLIIMFSFLMSVILKSEKPSPENGLNGSWLNVIVSTQSIAVLGGLLSAHLSIPSEITLFISMCAFLCGMMLYIIIIPIIFYRLTFYTVNPEQVLPSYWIDMGAAAISSLAATVLAEQIKSNIVYADFYSFVHAAALLFWSIGSFWIPIILLMQLWRYVSKHSPLKYSGEFWSMVFPLGMYTACTVRLSESMHLSFLHDFAGGFVYVAWAAWLATFIALFVHFLYSTRNPSPA
jgi:tellurite resistance protein TehA-like permease